MGKDVIGAHHLFADGPIETDRKKIRGRIRILRYFSQEVRDLIGKGGGNNS